MAKKRARVQQFSDEDEENDTSTSLQSKKFKIPKIKHEDRPTNEELKPPPRLPPPPSPPPVQKPVVSLKDEKVRYWTERSGVRVHGLVHKNPVSIVNEKYPCAEWSDNKISEKGTNIKFTVSLHVNDEYYYGTASNKKEARRLAAASCISKRLGLISDFGKHNNNGNQQQPATNLDLPSSNQQTPAAPEPHTLSLIHI